MNAQGVEFGDIALGTAQFAFKDVSGEQSLQTIGAALDAGVRLIDTALAYNRRAYESYAEHLVGLMFASRGRDAFAVATKGGHWREGDDFPVDGSRGALRSHCDRSLRALGIEQIDLYQLHHVDPEVPFEESIHTLEELRREGKIRLIGLSNVSIEQIDEARGITDIASVQNRLSFDQPEDLPTVDHCARLGIAYLAYAPLGGPTASSSNQADIRSRIATRLGATWQQVSLAWLLSISRNLVPVVGASRIETIVDSVASTRVQLSDEDLIDLAAAAAGG